MKYGFPLVCVGLLVFAFGLFGEGVDTLPVSAPGTIVIDIPREQVKREGRFMVAKAVTGKGTIKVDGKVYVGTVTFPDTKVRRTNVGEMFVDACQATGTVK